MSSMISKIATYSNYYLLLDFDTLHFPQVFLQYLMPILVLHLVLYIFRHLLVEYLSLHPKEKIEKLTISKIIKTFIISKMTDVVSSSQSWPLIFNNLHKWFNIWLTEWISYFKKISILIFLFCVYAPFNSRQCRCTTGLGLEFRGIWVPVFTTKKLGPENCHEQDTAAQSLYWQGKKFPTRLKIN